MLRPLNEEQRDYAQRDRHELLQSIFGIPNIGSHSVPTSQSLSGSSQTSYPEFLLQTLASPSPKEGNAMSSRSPPLKPFVVNT